MFETSRHFAQAYWYFKKDDFYKCSDNGINKQTLDKMLKWKKIEQL